VSKLDNTFKEIFCREYLKDFNGLRAYKATRPDVTDDSAKSRATKLLKNPEIQEMLTRFNKKRMDKLEIDADTVLRELHRIATCDILEAYDENGALKPIREIPKEIRKAISSVKTREEFDYIEGDKIKVADVVEVKFWDKVRSLEHLGKHIKLFTDKIEVTGDSLAEELKAARERLKNS
jgi:phage terminase small subunit